MPVLLPRHRLAIAVCLGLAAIPFAAVAEPAPWPKATATVPSAQAPNTTWTSAEPPPACPRSRRKLWQDGEGWVVKTVTLCP